MPTPLPLSEASRVLGLELEEARAFTESVFSDDNIAPISPSAMRRLCEARGFVYPERNLVFHCLKGGAAKTTLAYNTAYRLAQLGARVLLVDLDKQGNATHSLGVELADRVFVDAITGKSSVEELIVNIGEHLDLIPSSLENARLEMELIHRRKNPGTYYRQLFTPVRARYDFVVFDLPPDLSHNTYLCSLYADIVCIPANPDAYSVHGARLTLESLQSLRQEYEKLEQEVWLVWTKYDAREKSSVKYLRELALPAFARVLPVVIRTDITFKNAQGQSKSVFQMGKRSSAREDMDILAQELLGLRAFLTSTRGPITEPSA